MQIESNACGVKFIRLKCGITLQIHGDGESLFMVPTATEQYCPKPMQITTNDGKLFYGGIDIRLATLERLRRTR